MGVRDASPKRKELCATKSAFQKKTCTFETPSPVRTVVRVVRRAVVVSFDDLRAAAADARGAQARAAAGAQKRAAARRAAASAHARDARVPTRGQFLVSLDRERPERTRTSSSRVSLVETESSTRRDTPSREKERDETRCRPKTRQFQHTTGAETETLFPRARPRRRADSRAWRRRGRRAPRRRRCARDPRAPPACSRAARSPAESCARSPPASAPRPDPCTGAPAAASRPPPRTRPPPTRPGSTFCVSFSRTLRGSRRDDSGAISRVPNVAGLQYGSPERAPKHDPLSRDPRVRASYDTRTKCALNARSNPSRSWWTLTGPPSRARCPRSPPPWTKQTTRPTVKNARSPSRSRRGPPVVRRVPPPPRPVASPRRAAARSREARPRPTGPLSRALPRSVRRPSSTRSSPDRRTSPRGARSARAAERRATRLRARHAPRRPACSEDSATPTTAVEPPPPDTFSL